MLASYPASSMNENSNADGIHRDSGTVENALLYHVTPSGVWLNALWQLSPMINGTMGKRTRLAAVHKGNDVTELHITE